MALFERVQEELKERRMAGEASAREAASKTQQAQQVELERAQIAAVEQIQRKQKETQLFNRAVVLMDAMEARKQLLEIRDGVWKGEGVVDVTPKLYFLEGERRYFWDHESAPITPMGILTLRRNYTNHLQERINAWQGYDSYQELPATIVEKDFADYTSIRVIVTLDPLETVHVQARESALTWTENQLSSQSDGIHRTLHSYIIGYEHNFFENRIIGNGTISSKHEISQGEKAPPEILEDLLVGILVEHPWILNPTSQASQKPKSVSNKPWYTKLFD